MWHQIAQLKYEISLRVLVLVLDRLFEMTQGWSSRHSRPVVKVLVLCVVSSFLYAFGFSIGKLDLVTYYESSSVNFYALNLFKQHNLEQMPSLESPLLSAKLEQQRKGFRSTNTLLTLQETRRSSSQCQWASEFPITCMSFLINPSFLCHV